MIPPPLCASLSVRSVRSVRFVVTLSVSVCHHRLMMRNLRWLRVVRQVWPVCPVMIEYGAAKPGHQRYVRG